MNCSQNNLKIASLTYDEDLNFRAIQTNTSIFEFKDFSQAFFFNF